jgi:hypothetical protein
MRYVFSLIASLWLFAFPGLAQQRVALHHNGVTTIFSSSQPFVDAYNASVSGDTIYLPGIDLAIPPAINKGLVIFGVGHYPDSTAATGVTSMAGLTLQAGAAGSHFEVIRFTNSFTFSNSVSIDSVVLCRNYIGGNISIAGTGGANASNGIVIKENIITGNINAQNTNNIQIYNNIINNNISNIVNNGWIANNIFLRPGPPYYFLINVHQSRIENNIISLDYILSNCANNQFIKNIFTKDPTGITNNIWQDSWVNQDLNTVFVNYQHVFSYSADYHLKLPGNFIGTTGNQVGIYGGLFPAKEGGVPANPHISSKNIGAMVDQQGKLEVQIKAVAQ